MQSSCRFMNAQSKLRVASQCISPMHTALYAALNNQTTFASFNQCDKPQITDVQPSKLPIGGGTLLTISGVYLGSTRDDVIGVNINCGQSGKERTGGGGVGRLTVKCDMVPLKYVTSKKIVCKTRQSASGPLNHCRASVKLRSSSAGKNADPNSGESQNGGLMSIQVSG